MKPSLLPLLAASALVLLPAAADAQRWPSIHAREQAFNQRIEDGERSGAISPEEADRLHAMFEDLLRREDSYRFSPPGFTPYELQDLDRRFDLLSDRISRDFADAEREPNRFPDRRRDRDTDRPADIEPPPPPPPPTPPPPPPPPPEPPRLDERYSGVDEGWASMNERRAALMERIDQAVRAGDLAGGEADRLRADFEALVRLERDDREDGFLSSNERRDLDRRYAALAARAGQSKPEDDDRWRDIRNIQADLDARIDEAKADGVVNADQARRLHDDASDLVGLEDDYRASAPGLTASEIEDLDRRIAAIEARIERPTPPPERDPPAVNDFSR